MEKDNNQKILRQIFSSNLSKLLAIKGINKSGLAKQTEVSLTSINNYLNEVNDPPISFLLALKKQYDINIDDFVTKNLTDDYKLKLREKLNFSAKKFVGNYILYFYQSSAYKGSGVNPTKDPLKYGVLSVLSVMDYTTSKSSSMKVLTNFFSNRTEAEEFKETLDLLKTDNEKIIKLYKGFERVYKGSLELTNTQAFISLRSNYCQDKVSIILNNPPSRKNYVGGLGTVNSIARGREPAPVIQYIILSRHSFIMTDNEIYGLLSLNVESLDVRNEALKLIEQFKVLYLDSNIKLEEYQRNYIMQNNIENAIIENIKRNLFRYGKVSNREDDKYYRLIMSYKKQ